MSVKTLNPVHSAIASTAVSPARTYSIEPMLSLPRREQYAATSNPLEIFLEAENPLGCIRGVMWVMAFNAAVFALGFAVWQAFKFLP